MMTDADKLQLLWDRHQIEALNHTFGRSLDGGSVEDYLSIFAPDVDYRTGPKQLRGHAALRDFFETRAAQGRVSRHLMCQLEVTPHRRHPRLGPEQLAGLCRGGRSADRGLHAVSNGRGRG